MRTSWRDAIAACPPILITIAFKIFVLRPYATQFKYFAPSPEELVDLARESQRSYKQRFIHPALGNETLYTIMVHKEQQELVRMILAPYSRKLQSEVAGVREVRVATAEQAMPPTCSRPPPLPPRVEGPGRVQPSARSDHPPARCRHRRRRPHKPRRR